MVFSAKTIGTSAHSVVANIYHIVGSLAEISLVLPDSDTNAVRSWKAYRPDLTETAGLSAILCNMEILVGENRKVSKADCHC